MEGFSIPAMTTGGETMRVVGVIPARYASTRLEGKPLRDIGGKPMVQHVYEAARQARLLDTVIVATEDHRVVDVVEHFGGHAVLTSARHPTGSDRVAEVVRSLEADVVVNIQGDEPLLDPSMIDEVVQPMLDDATLEMSTLCVPIDEEARMTDPHVVKVVFDLRGNALYFSRSLLPYPRSRERFPSYEHLGLYAYRKSFLLDYVLMPQTPLELAESLEQLRVLETGHTLRVVVTKHPYRGLSVDTAEDLEQVRSIIARAPARPGSV
jgi:3-deoxy-manno-octulosonate cytidylyltransferase (CMP-KDO synthetase)